MVGQRLAVPRAGSKGSKKGVEPVRRGGRRSSPSRRAGRPAGPELSARALTPPVVAVVFDLGDTLLDEGKGWFADDPLLPGVRRTLGELEVQYRLAVLSNTRRATRADVSVELDRLGIGRHFRAIMTSTDIGWRKPHPLAFEAVLSALGVTAGDCVMVGNELDADVAGAKAMGMRTVHFRWSPRYRLDPSSESEQATVTIEEFNDVPVAIEQARGEPSPPRTAVIREESLFREGLAEKEEENHVV